MTTNKIITWTEADKLGLKKYFTGSTCTKGHVSERYFPGGNCVECLREYGRSRKKYKAEYRANNTKKIRESNLKYYRANRDTVLARNKVYRDRIRITGILEEII